MNPTGINQNDIANFVSKSSTWNAHRVASLRKIFGENLEDRSLLIMRVQGRLDSTRQVDVSYTPFIMLAPDTTRFNPTLDIASD